MQTETDAAFITRQYLNSVGQDGHRNTVRFYNLLGADRKLLSN